MNLRRVPAQWLRWAFLLLLLPANATERPSRLGVPALALGIVEFTRWPEAQRPVLLCLTLGGPQGKELAAALPAHPLGQRLSLRELPANGELPLACDAMLFEAWNDEAQAATLRRQANRPLLTLGLGPQFCSQGGAVCFGVEAQQAPFEVNTDALARSGLRVSPRVLLLTRGRKAP